MASTFHHYQTRHSYLNKLQTRLTSRVEIFQIASVFNLIRNAKGRIVSCRKTSVELDNSACHTRVVHFVSPFETIVIDCQQDALKIPNKQTNKQESKNNSVKRQWNGMQHTHAAKMLH